MDTLIKLIQQRTGIDESQARTAAETVLGFLKDRLPGPVAGQLDRALAGGTQTGEGDGSMMDAAKGMFGKGGGR